MSPLIKKILIGVGSVIGVAVLGGGTYVWSQVSAYETSMEKVYDIPIPTIELSTDPDVLARGKHLAASLSPCADADCHGRDLSGGTTIELGPLGTITGPNITKGGLGMVYSDGEIARLIEHGVKKDGHGLRFMPAHEFNWLPKEDIVAVVSYLRTVADSKKENGPMRLGTLAKVLDRHDSIIIDVARRIDHGSVDKAPPPTPTKEYGRFIGRLCMGCHGKTFGGGPIPGAPPDLPPPLNITPHETGLAGWTFEDFNKLLDTGVRKNGAKLDPFMPITSLAAMDETERKALWAFLQSLPPMPMGSR